MTDGPVPWLTELEKESWSALGSLMMLLPGKIEAPMQADAGLTLFEYLVLSALSEAPDRTLRMSEIAYLASGSLSRLSNVVRRFEQRGWAERRPDPTDGRYTLASLTAAGTDVVVAAAPAHVRAVRETVVDRLDTEDLAALRRIAARLGVRPA